MKFLLPILTSLIPLGLSHPLSFLFSTTRQTPELEAETDRLLFRVSLSEFIAAHNAQSPPELDWSTDGCSNAPDNPFGFDFAPACWRHDFGYRNYKAQGRFEGAGKAAIDSNFRDDLYDQCAASSSVAVEEEVGDDDDGVEAQGLCEVTADIYYKAVVLFGRQKELEELEQLGLESEQEDGVGDS